MARATARQIGTHLTALVWLLAAAACGPQMALQEQSAAPILRSGDTGDTGSDTGGTSGGGSTGGSTTGGSADGGTTGAPQPTLQDLFDGCRPDAVSPRGIGHACTKGGNECANQAMANLCLADAFATPTPICTSICQAAGDCGDGATCLQDPRNAKVFVCVPDSCVPTNFAAPKPTPLRLCLPGGRGNSINVGQACTAGGGECPLFMSCTADLVANAPLAYCTKVACQDGGCGDNATCETAVHNGRTVRACAPNACLP